MFGCSTPRGGGPRGRDGSMTKPGDIVFRGHQNKFWGHAPVAEGGTSDAGTAKKRRRADSSHLQAMDMIRAWGTRENPAGEPNRTP